jgi:hypothetical protein
MLGAILPILKHRATWGVGIALGVLVAIAAHGRLRYAAGYDAGFVARAVDAHADALTARAIADSTWAVLYAQALDARDAQRSAEQAAARAETRTRRATARLDDALAAVQADPTPQTPQCTALATSCAQARAAWDAERDSLHRVIATTDTLQRRAAAMAMAEPIRLQSALRVALEQQRQTFRAPSRVTWGTVGALVGAVVTLGLVR